MSRPTEGGSYIRKPDGTLERVALLQQLVDATRPAAPAEAGAAQPGEPEVPAAEPPRGAPAPSKPARVKKDA